MGARCCTDRKDTAAGRAGAAAIAPGLKHDRKSIGAFDPKKRGPSLGYTSKGGDAEKFDKAFDSNDLKSLAELLTSQQKLESFEERMHPWAEDPKTIGALAGTQIAFLASVAEKDNPNVKDEIRKAGAIPPLVDFLRSEQTDRVQTAVVALSFLTSECSGNAVAVYEGGAVPLLMKHLDSGSTGMRAAAATTLRNLCMEKQEYRKEFVKLGGIKGLVTQLSTTADPSLNHADVQFEAILNLQDVIEYYNNVDGVIEEYALQAISAGAEEKLEQLLLSEDKEVRGSATELLAALGKAKSESAARQNPS